jgi:SAM-dependent methyltransferase
MSKNEKPASERKIAVDFGCGTGWLTQKLPTLGYTDVYGIDLSPAMIKKAFFGTPQHLVSEGTVVYSNELPREIVGKCDLVTAVQVHYHFVPFEQLKNDFFGKISSYLRPNGQAVIIGCPSDFVHDTPDHYQNCVHIDDVPPEVLSKATRPDLLADEDGFIALSCLPKYKLEDGTQMKVSFSAYDKNNKMHVHTLFDTFWSDQTMIKTASKMGLDLLHHETLAWDNYPNAYMAMLFKKRPSSTPVSCCLA